MVCEQHNWFMFSLPCPKCASDAQKVTAPVTESVLEPEGLPHGTETISQTENPEIDPWEIPKFLRRRVGEPIPHASGPLPGLPVVPAESFDPRITKFMTRIRNRYPRSLTDREVLDAEIARGNQQAADVLAALDNRFVVGKETWAKIAAVETSK